MRVRRGSDEGSSLTINRKGAFSRRVEQRDIALSSTKHTDPPPPAHPRGAVPAEAPRGAGEVREKLRRLEVRHEAQHLRGARRGAHHEDARRLREGQAAHHVGGVLTREEAQQAGRVVRVHAQQNGAHGLAT
eukprot:1190911-Prorocentrum_minimum.AAC.2